VTELPRLTPKSIGSIEALRADLDIVRRRGHAIDDEETVEGVICLGVAIPARRPGEGPYAASVTLLKARATEDRVAALVGDLGLLATRLSDPMRVAMRRSESARDGKGPGGRTLDGSTASDQPSR
jgi:DNA-binding IclR family transcriptional regulator